MASPLSSLAASYEVPMETHRKASDTTSDDIEVEGNRSRPSRRIPNEILLAILAQSSPSTLAAFAQTSFAFLEVASPLLYNSVTLDDSKQGSQFFNPPHVFPSHLSRIEPFTSRTQTKHLITAFEHRDHEKHPIFLPPTGPLLLDSYSHKVEHECLNNHVNPSLYVATSVWSHPTVLGQVSARTTQSFLVDVSPKWDRLRDIVFPGYFLDSIPLYWGNRWKNYRVTLDLSIIEQRVDPRSPKGSCQRVLEEFGRTLGGARGRVWVRSEAMREMFEVAKEEVVKRLDGSTLGKEVEKITVEISMLC